MGIRQKVTFEKVSDEMVEFSLDGKLFSETTLTDVAGSPVKKLLIREDAFKALMAAAHKGSWEVKGDGIDWDAEVTKVEAPNEGGFAPPREGTDTPIDTNEASEN